LVPAVEQKDERQAANERGHEVETVDIEVLGVNVDLAGVHVVDGNDEEAENRCRCNVVEAGQDVRDDFRNSVRVSWHARYADRNCCCDSLLYSSCSCSSICWHEVIAAVSVITAVSAITAVTEADDIAAVGPEADKDGGVAVAEVSVTTAVIDVEVNTAGGTEVDKDAGIEVIGAVIDVDETTALVTGVFVGTTGAAIAGIFGAGVAPDGAVVKAGVTGIGAAVWLPFALILENKS